MSSGELNNTTNEKERARLAEAAIERIGTGKPVVVINLLRFRESADYSGLTPAASSPVSKDGSDPCSGEEAYFERYIPAYHEVCKSYWGKDHNDGQKILYLGKDMMPLLNLGRLPSSGEQGDENYWHGVIIIRYPSFERATEFRKSDAYWQANFHRAAALEDNVAWITDPVDMAG